MSTQLEKRDKREVANTAAEQLIESGNAYAPDVDIYSSNDDVVFAIDLPGVEKGDVDIEINENNTLIITGKCSHSEPNKAIMQQYRVGNYYRSFQVADDFNKDAVSASLENGLLLVTLPKREEVKPKKIAITA